MMFGAGMMWGAAISGGGCNWGWGHGDIDVDIDHNYNSNRNVDRNTNRTVNREGNRSSWKHNPEHRKGVNYRNGATAKQYGGQGGSNRVTRDQARGFDRGASAST